METMLFEDKLFTTIMVVFIACLVAAVMHSDDDDPPDISIWKDQNYESKTD